MQLHQIRRGGPKTKNKEKKRVGRGGKRGTYSGKGMKGQKSRAGAKMRPEMRDIIKKLPKLRGYRFNAFREKPEAVNLGVLEKNFDDNAKINPQTLLEKKIIATKKGKTPLVKILSSGNITKKLSVSECQISASAKEKIEKAGGSVKSETRNPKSETNSNKENSKH
ncbi:MAG: 50S ribosomal protein L15 [bacterium]|nr:50S ribosomal protein L15 [bacterium]